MLASSTFQNPAVGISAVPLLLLSSPFDRLCHTNLQIKNAATATALEHPLFACIICTCHALKAPCSCLTKPLACTGSSFTVQLQIAATVIALRHPFILAGIIRQCSAPSFCCISSLSLAVFPGPCCNAGPAGCHRNGPRPPPAVRSHHPHQHHSRRQAGIPRVPPSKSDHCAR